MKNQRGKQMIIFFINDSNHMKVSADGMKEIEVRNYAEEYGMSLREAIGEVLVEAAMQWKNSDSITFNENSPSVVGRYVEEKIAAKTDAIKKECARLRKLLHSVAIGLLDAGEDVWAGRIFDGLKCGEGDDR